MRAQRRRLEDVDTGVDLGDGCLVLGRVLLLDDAQDGAVGIADDAAVAGRIVDVRAQHGGGGRTVAVRRARGRRACRPRAAAHRRSARARRRRSRRARRGPSRPPGRCRARRPGRRRRAGREVAHSRGHLVALVAHDDDHALRLRARTRCRAHARRAACRRCGAAPWAATDFMRVPWPAARTMTARPESNDVLGHAPPPGLEPGPNSSKGCRAAITPRRTAAPEADAARQVCQPFDRLRDRPIARAQDRNSTGERTAAR